MSPEEEKDQGDAEEPEDASGDDEVETTAKSSGPAAAAKKAVGDIVPKEDNISELEDEE